MKERKQLVKLANLYLSSLIDTKGIRLRTIRDRLKTIEQQSSMLLSCSKKFYAAMDKHWFFAAERMLTKIYTDIFDLSGNLAYFRELVNTDQGSLPCVSDIVAELECLSQEFDNFSFDFKDKSISVITDYIELDGLSLGRFEIKLFVKNLGEIPFERPYDIIALEPNPAVSDSNVTHPHISHEKLCEGESFTAIAKALNQARLADFFNMVIGILENYNPQSPYVSLDNWNGINCCDCGCVMVEEQIYYCEHCDSEYCESCRTYCQICDVNICYGCTFECSACGELVCGNCRCRCKKCSDTYCKDCLTDGFCESCLEKIEDDDYEDNQTIGAVQPYRVG